MQVQILLKTALHFVYTLSLLLILLVVTLNVSIPVSLKWPAYCSTICGKGVPMREQCQSFCTLHDNTYTRVWSFSGLSKSHMKSLLDKEGFLAAILQDPMNVPGWFIVMNILFCASSFVSAVFWSATVLGDFPASCLKKPARLASYFSLVFFAAYAVFVIAMGGHNGSFQRTLNLYNRKELCLLSLMISSPMLQLFVARNIPNRRKR